MVPPTPCTTPTCVPCGALGLPLVKPLPLPATPVELVNVQGEPLGSYSKSPKAPVPTTGVSKPGSTSVVGVTALDATTIAKLSVAALPMPLAASTTPLNVPTVVGVPEIRPAELNVRPLGSVPEASVNDGLGVPVAEYWNE